MSSMPTTPAPAAPSPAAAPSPSEPLHGCVRCGARIPVSESMCENCNPLGLKAPSASQAHGIGALGIIVAVVVLAVVARLATSGVGPFTSSLAGVAADPAGLRVTITVTNGGSGAGTTTCRVSDPKVPGIGPEAAFVSSPVIQPGATRTFDAVVTSLGTTVRPLVVDCDT